MRRRSLMIGLLGLLLMLFVAGAAIAQSSTHFDLGWNVLAGGGGSAARQPLRFRCDVGSGGGRT